MLQYCPAILGHILSQKKQKAKKKLEWYFQGFCGQMRLEGENEFRSEKNHRCQMYKLSNFAFMCLGHWSTTNQEVCPKTTVKGLVY